MAELYLWRRKKKTWITFKYERLPNICYWCGRLDHNDRDCEIWLESEGSLAENQKQFGLSLRAPSFSPARRSVVAVPGFYTPKRKSVPPPASEIRHETEGSTSNVSPPMEEQTVVHNLAVSVNTLKTQLVQETVTIKELILSKNDNSDFNDHAPKMSPYNPDPITAVVDDTIMPEIYGDNRDSPSTDTGDFIPINASDHALRTNQSQAAAALKPTHPTNSNDPVSREMHEITRAQKKPSTWTRLDRATATQKTSPSASTGACKRNLSLDRATATQKTCPSASTGVCKRNFLDVDDHSELPTSKRQVPKDGAKFSFQVVKADDQPCQQP